MPGARPVPMSQVPTLVGTLPTDQPVYLVCAVGARSGQVAAWLGQQGYDTVNVDGGTQEWVTRGLPGRALTADAPDTTPGFEVRSDLSRNLRVASPDPPAWRTCGRRILPRTRSRSIQRLAGAGDPRFVGPQGS